MSVQAAPIKRITTQTLQLMKQSQSPIAMLTAYDSTFASLFEAAGIHALLIGDSLGMVMQGNSHTLSVTVEDIIYHCRAVARATTQTHLIADMPFMSYQADESSALHNAGRMLKEGGAHAIKIEGGAHYATLISRMVSIGIPVMGHIGLEPQSIHRYGGFYVQGRESAQAEKILKDAHALEAAGCYAIVLESIPEALAEKITHEIKIPTIGIGAGIHCDGQILVMQDMLGLLPNFKPKFVKHYANLAETVTIAVKNYISEVRENIYPDKTHSY